MYSVQLLSSSSNHSNDHWGFHDMRQDPSHKHLLPMNWCVTNSSQFLHCKFVQCLSCSLSYNHPGIFPMSIYVPTRNPYFNLDTFTFPHMLGELFHSCVHVFSVVKPKGLCNNKPNEQNANNSGQHGEAHVTVSRKSMGKIKQAKELEYNWPFPLL